MPEPTCLQTLDFILNGTPVSVQAHPGEPLIAVLQRLGCSSVQQACDGGECGACAVLVDGVAHNSCAMFAMQASQRCVTTLEGLEAHPLQEAFAEMAATQCGYCKPGMLVTLVELLGRNEDPTVDDVKDALSGNLCRCTGYHRPVRTVLDAVRKRQDSRNQCQA